MGKLKKSSSNTPENEQLLKDEVKKQRSIIKHLERELKKSHQSKGNSKEHQNNLIEEDYDKQDEVNKCPKCERGRITVTDLGVRQIKACSIKCGYKEIIKPNGKKEEAEET